LAKRTIRILLADDHDLVRTGISRLLADEEGIQIVAEASNGEEAVKLVRETTPDVVLMDLKMPGIGGLQATINLLRIHPECKVIVLTVCHDEPFPSRLLQAGASGYLTKECDTAEMVRAIKTVLAGQMYLSPNIANQLALKQVNHQQSSPFEMLTERELQVMLMITKGLKVQEISDKLCLSPKTVNSHRYKLFEKLKIQSDVELTLLAIRHGMLDEDALA